MKQIINSAVLFTALILILFPGQVTRNSAYAAHFGKRELDIAVSGGVWLDGKVKAAGTIDENITKETDFLLRVFFDFYITRKLAAGVYSHYSPVSLSSGNVNSEGSLTEIGGAFKLRFPVLPGLSVKPGLNIGYRKINSDNADLQGEALGINLGVEIQYKLQSNLILFIEPGFLTQPSGGNDNIEYTHGPIWYINAGICF